MARSALLRIYMTGVMAAVVSGHYGAAVTTRRTKRKRPAPSGRTLCAHGAGPAPVVLIVTDPALWAHGMRPDEMFRIDRSGHYGDL